mgnify:CR=1 FL=1
MSAGKAIGFRLDEAQVARLTDEAKKQGRSPGDLARSLVLEALDGPENDDVLTELAALRTEVEALRRKFGASNKDLMPKLTADLNALRSEFEDLRQDLALSVHLLLKSCRRPPLIGEELKRWESECREWVTENLKS